MADVTVATADVRPLPGALSVRVQAAEIIDLGEIVYVDGNGKAALADCNALASSEVLGIVVSAPGGKAICAADEWVDVVYIGPLAWGAGMTPGGYVFVSIEPGKGTQTVPAAASGYTGALISMVGIALTATTILVNPFLDDMTVL